VASGPPQGVTDDLVVGELEQVLGAEDERTDEIASAHGGEDLRSLAGVAGHGQTLAFGLMRR
jgi:hypothetical protein